MKRIPLLLIICLASMSAEAQFDNLMKKAVDKSKSAATTGLEDERTRIDSSDFNYAISVIDNSGMMDIRDADETVIKTASSVSSLTKKEIDKTAALRCRDFLDIAEKLYESRAYPPAELAFLTAKQAYETEGITSNINYSKVLADLGLLYATMGRYSTSEKLTQDALEQREKNLGKNSKAYASSLNNHGVLMQELAR